MDLRPALALPLLAFAAPALAQHEAADWREAESDFLKHHTQLTFPEQFEKAGEAYFSADSSWIIFQAVPKTDASAKARNPHYSMYVAKLIRDANGRIDSISEPIMVSDPGSANTCGFFDPTSNHDIIFGSTRVPPASRSKSGYQRDTSDYAWQFPNEMEVCARSVAEIAEDQNPGKRFNWSADAFVPKPLWTREGYDAECAFSPDGRFIVNTQVDPETGDGDLYIFDTETEANHPIVIKQGYDGGPFFSPDGKRLCYRSDRAGNDLLQVYVADLKFDDEGVPIGVEHEHQITNNRHVNWAPYFHPSGRFLVYTTSEVGHHNYEVYAVQIPAYGQIDAQLAPPIRVTQAPGFDGMPVFSNDGEHLMWTSQRGGKLEGQERPSSQIWIADIVDPEEQGHPQ